MADKDRTAGKTKCEWIAPELARLGTIRDIAQGPTPIAQANNAKRS